VPPALGPGVQLVETADALEAAVSKLAGAEFFYLDTEFDSSRDGTRLSLIQVSRGAEIHLIDALELADLTPLARALGEPASTWVLHAGQQDVALLTARLGIPRPARVFDTQVVWALVTVEHSTALAYLKYRLLGLRGEKTHQADDWLRRPLPRAQLEYAADDVLHLPEIQRRLSARCAELGRERAALLASAEPLASNVEPPAPLTLDAFRNAWQLEHTGQAVLRFLIDWFNGLPLAERSTAPDQKGLLAIASRRPRSLEELGGLRAVPRRTVNLHGRTLLAGIERALSSADRAEFVAIDPPPYATIEEILAEGWLGALRAEVSAELGVAPELGFPARLMRRMREAAVEQGRVTAAAECLTGWRAEVLGAEFLARAGRFGALSKASSR
jgi:ribonuclease D